MIIDPIIRSNPICPEYLGQLLIIWFAQESFKSIYLIHNTDVNHSHDHDPKVEQIFEQDKLGLSFIFGGKHCLKNVLEREHPAAVHQVCDVHVLVLESENEVDE